MATFGMSALLALWMYGFPMVGVEGVYSHEYQRAIASVQSLADKQTDAYEQWFVERRNELKLLSMNEALSKDLSTISHAATDTNIVKMMLQRQLHALKESTPGTYNYLYFVDPQNGHLLASSEPDWTTAPQQQRTLILDAAEPGLNQFVYIDNALYGANVFITSQILGKNKDGVPNGTLPAILIASIALNAPLIDQDIAIKQKLGTSGNLFLINQERQILVNLSNTPSKHDYEFIANHIVSGTEGVKLLENNNDETVITVFRHLQLGTENGLSLAVARGTNELLSATHIIFTRMAWLVALLFLGFMVLVRFASKHIAIAESKIVELNHTLENRVEERTHELEQANHCLLETLSNLEHTRDGLLRSEKLAALGAMVAGIAHELNTPIGNCVTVASTLQDHAIQFAHDMQDKTKGLSRSRLDQFINDSVKGSDILMRSLFQAAELISSFKQVAVDQSSVNLRHFRLSDTVTEIVITLGPTIRKTTHTVHTMIPPDIMMESYPGPLGQILINLINNALLHAFDGRQNGKITIAAEALKDSTIRLTVTDDGIGIPTSNLNRVFDPFFTTKLGFGGSGLGLNITYNLIQELLGGDIHVTSTEGQGTCFTLTLPLRAPSPPTVAQSSLT